MPSTRVLCLWFKAIRLSSPRILETSTGKLEKLYISHEASAMIHGGSNTIRKGTTLCNGNALAGRLLESVTNSGVDVASTCFWRGYVITGKVFDEKVLCFYEVRG
jgi:hypothetical protein